MDLLFHRSVILLLLTVLAFNLTLVPVSSDTIVGWILSFRNDQSSLRLCKWLLLTGQNISNIDLSVGIGADRVLKIDPLLILAHKFVKTSVNRVVVVTQRWLPWDNSSITQLVFLSLEVPTFLGWGPHHSRDVLEVLGLSLVLGEDWVHLYTLPRDVGCTPML